MDQYNLTGSVSDRRGWEWNRKYGDGAEETSSHPRTFAPERYGGSGDRGIREPGAGRLGTSDSSTARRDSGQCQDSPSAVSWPEQRDLGRHGVTESRLAVREGDSETERIAGITESETLLGGDTSGSERDAGCRRSSCSREPTARTKAGRGEPDPDTLQRELAELREETRQKEQRRDAIIRQYERCLAEKNRQLADDLRGRSRDGTGGQGADLLTRLLDPLQR